MDLISLTVVSINGKTLTAPVVYGFDTNDIAEAITNDGTYSKVVIRSIKGIDQQKRSQSKVVYEVSENLAAISALSDHLFLCDVTYRGFSAVSLQAVFVADHVSGGFYTASGPATTFYYAEDGAPDLIRYIVSQTVSQIVAQTAIVIPNAWILGGNTLGAVQNFGTVSNHPIPFIVNNVQRMHLSTTGLGIGTTASYRLDVASGSNALTAIARFANTGVNFKVYANDSSPEGIITADQGDLCVVDDGTNGSLYQKTSGTGTNTGWSLIDSNTSDWNLDGNTVGAEKWFGTIDNFEVPLKVNNTEVARLFSNGLLVGTTTPFGTEALGVNGDVYIDGKLTVTGIIDPTQIQFTGATTPDGTKYEVGFDVSKLYSNVPTGSIVEWRENNVAHSVVNTGGKWVFGTVASYPAQLAVYNSSGSSSIMRLYDNIGTQFMTVADAGYVLIGTTTQDVSGPRMTIAGGNLFFESANTGLKLKDSLIAFPSWRYSANGGKITWVQEGNGDVAYLYGVGNADSVVPGYYLPGTLSVRIGGVVGDWTGYSNYVKLFIKTISATTSDFGVQIVDSSLNDLFIVDGTGKSFSFGGAYGSRSASGNLTLGSTSNVTKGKILFGTSGYDETTNCLGLATASPLFTLSVNGSMGFKFVAKTANYPMTSTDMGIYADVNGITITIPNAATYPNMVVAIKNRVAAASTINIASAGGLIEGAAGDTVTNSGATYTTKWYHSDGANWNRIF